LALRIFILYAILFQSFQLSPIERYAMKFVEKTGANWVQQIKAVEMEIEQQKREWEEKRLAQLQQEEVERMKAAKEDEELLTYSREDALNKVNIKSSYKSNRKSTAAAIVNNKHRNDSIVSSKRLKSESASQSKLSPRGKSNSSNGTPQAIIRNGIVKKSSPIKKAVEEAGEDSLFRRNTRNTCKSVLSVKDEKSIVRHRATSRKSDRSNSSAISKKTTVRSTSESTTRSTSISQQTSSVQDDSDSECSLDVMIDSNDVNDSDSNSNAKCESNFDSTSQDDTVMNDDNSTITDDTTIERTPRHSNSSGKPTSSPRTRSRGTVKINLWSLDDSPILPPKRQKSSFQLANEISHDQAVKTEFGLKECKISVVDLQTRNFKSSPQSRTQKRLMTSARNNHTLDSWVQKVPEPLQRPQKAPTTSNEGDQSEDKTPQRTTRQRNATIHNKTL
jgi:hypothetical protein